MKLFSNFLIFTVGLIHVYFFILERFIWRTPKGHKIFKLTAEQAAQSATLAANQGVYNLLLGLGLFWSLLADNNNSTKGIQFFILIYIFVCGIYGAMTVGKNIFFMQSLPALLAVFLLIKVTGEPMMNDIVTNTYKPIEFSKLIGKPYPKEFPALQKKFFPEVSSLMTNKSAMDVFQKVQSLIHNQTNWKVVHEDQAQFIIEATEQTKFFRFTDDIMVQVLPQGSGSVVEMRSRSRTGRSDFGVNAKRIMKFLNQLQTEL